MSAVLPIGFIDLLAQRAHLKDQIDAAVMRVLNDGKYILGPETVELEKQLAAFCYAPISVACANGTDAIVLVLLAQGIGKGDAVFVPSFTFAATAEVVALVGATPVFVDVLPDTYCMDPVKLDAAIADVKKLGDFKPKAVIGVDLFGQLADYRAIAPIARAHGLYLIADSAQGYGATIDGQHPLHWCDAATTSFYPAKPLGCYGDGGAIFVKDAETETIIRSFRNHGQGVDKYDNIRIGVNSRLDTIQAAILLVKLSVFAEEISLRMKVAARYAELLAGAVKTPYLPDGFVSSWAQYTVEVADPDGFAAKLREKSVPTARYYPRPLHLQTAYLGYPRGAGGLPVTEDIMGRVISLPMHPYLTDAQIAYVAEAVKASV